MSEKRLVNAIAYGTIIDHIPAGRGLSVLSALGINQETAPVTLGVNLKSATCQRKDLIKISNCHLSTEQLAYLGMLADGVTVNDVEDYQIISKFKVPVPEQIVGFLTCPNTGCVSRHEPVSACFIRQPDKRYLRCYYCERQFAMTLFEEAR